VTSSGGYSFGLPGFGAGPDRDQLHRSAIRAIGTGTEEDALARLSAAPLRNLRDPRLWQAKALLHRELGELQEAIAAFDEAAALAGRDALILHGRARARMEAGVPSVAAYRDALAVTPGDNDLLLGLIGALAADLGAPAAIAELEDVLDRNPGWGAGQDALCRLRWQSGEREGFAVTLEGVLRRYPKDLRLWQLLIMILSQRDLNERMLDTVLRGQASAGEHLIFTANEAVARAELGQVAEADRLFERLKNVDEPSLRVRWVRHLLRSGRTQQAADLAYAGAQGPAAILFWPYVSVAWRLLGDKRWEWLEGDERLVGIYDLSERLAPLDRLAERLRGLHVSSAEPLEQSVRGGTQTDGPLLSRLEPEIRSLRAAIVETVHEHIRAQPPVDPSHPVLRHRRDAPVRIAGSWSVRLTDAGFHTNHIHPQGWFSSALYVALPDQDQRGAPPAGWLSLGVPQKELGLDLPPIRDVEPKPGRLVLFPSIMWHGTHPFGSGERLTCAFDVAQPR
jgi:tetratricopeptide (TPR) repeat protein